MSFCYKCNQNKNKDEMYCNKTLGTFRNICKECKKDESVEYNLKKATTEDKRTIIHLRNVLRKMVEALADRDSKKLRLYADVAKLEIGTQKCEARWSKDVAGN